MLKRVGLLQWSKKQQHIFIFLFFTYITLLLSKTKLIDIGTYLLFYTVVRSEVKILFLFVLSHSMPIQKWIVSK